MRYTLPLLALTLFLASCRDAPTGNDEKTTMLTRRWVMLSVDPPGAPNSATPGMIMEFNTDGTVTFTSPTTGTTILSVRWSWLNDRTKIRFIGIPNRPTYDVEVTELTQTRLKLKHTDDGDVFVETYQAQ